MRKGVKAVALQKEHAVEQDDAPSKVEFTISFNPFPAKMKPQSSKAKAITKKPKAVAKKEC